MNIQLEPNWLDLDLAAAHGSTQWVKQFIRESLPQLIHQAISPEDFAAAFEQALIDRNLSTPPKQKNYRSNIVRALKTIDEHHPANALCQEAISLVSPTSEQYREMNDHQRGRLSDRTTKYFTSETAQQLADRATQLLDSAEWSEVGAGLAVLIGRRISEILLSKFSLQSPWSLQFREMAKKANAHGLSIEIPTLAPAHKVLDAIDRLQNTLRMDDLKDSVSSRVAKQTVNQKFSQPIAQRCDQHFGEMIPTRSDRDNLYTHIFRATYATISAHWFCPVEVPEHQFKAEIQGHFTIDKDGKKLPNYSARANYDDYAISTQDGNRDGRLGIKLGQLPDLQVIEAFRDRKTIQDKADKTNEPATRIKLDVRTMNAIVARATPLLISHDAQEIAIALLVLTGRIPQTLIEGDWKEASKFSIQLDSLELEIPTLTSAHQVLNGVQKLRKVQPPLSDGWLNHARDLFQGLVDLDAFTDLQAIYTQIALFRFCPEEIEDKTFVQAIHGTTSDRVQLESDHRGSWLDQRNVQVLQVFQSPELTMTTDAKRDQFTAIPVDLTLLQSVCELVGIEITGEQGYENAISELLKWVASIDLVDTDGQSGDAEKQKEAEPLETTQPQAQTPDPEAVNLIQVLSHQAKTLALLSNQVETLQIQNQQLQQERDTAIAAAQLHSSQPSPNLALQQEMEDLRQQNVQLHSRVRHLLLALSGDDDRELISPPQTEPEIATQPDTPPIQQSQTPPETSQAKTEKEPRRSRGNATAKIHQIIDAVIHYNQQQSEPLKRVRISIPLIKTIGLPLKATYQPAIQQVLEQRKEELENLHQQWMIGQRHNAGVKNLEEIVEMIQHDLIGVDQDKEMDEL